MTKTRGFEVVKESNRQHFEEVKIANQKKKVYYDINTPIRADKRSAGYDFYCPQDVEVLPGSKTIVYTDIKAYMQDDEVLKLYPRSSLGIKAGLMLGNTVGVIDSSYYENEGNDGNIGISLLNTSGTTIKIKAGERFAQGIFQKYLTTDEDSVLSDKRTGGFGSSGK